MLPFGTGATHVTAPLHAFYRQGLNLLPTEEQRYNQFRFTSA